MTLLSEEGRWLKVRVQGRTEFVPRSKVDMPDNTEIGAQHATTAVCRRAQHTSRV